MGASGHLMRLDPRTGDVVWQQELRKVAMREPPMWGFCSSPLVTNSLVIVHAGGAGDKGILAFDVATGELKWSMASGDHSYSSPQLGNVGGEPMVLMLTNNGESFNIKVNVKGGGESGQSRARQRDYELAAAGMSAAAMSAPLENLYRAFATYRRKLSMALN